MISSSALPDFTFIDDTGAARTVALSQEAARIRFCADSLSARAHRGAAVGLCFRSGPDLVLWWLGAVLAGLRPLVVQYPTGKQARSYWQSSVVDTIAKAELTVIACDDAVRARLDDAIPDMALTCPIGRSDDDSAFVVAEYEIIQLSSGTTGFRKAMAFASDDLVRHSRDYNQTLRLTGQDRIVSWLPLYHDMGYVACFVMPLILGVPVVMMDPETWVKDKGILYRAIVDHGGTVCYMPNFGFEVMTSVPAPPMPRMRLWVSCSEPVLERTSRRFVDHIGAADETFAACYAMAENIFAMTQSVGISARQIDGQSVVSNGAPIAGVEIRIVEGEIWVRSPTSIKSYLGGDSITDADGFYPTGDLGVMEGGALYVTGRKRDLMIQAGKKFMLSSVDAAVNKVFPDARGRVASLEDFDPLLGTSKPVILIEAEDFFLRSDHRDVAAKVLEETGLDHVEIHFVPPRFLTKTSSGKMNRAQSLAHWKAVQEGEDGPASTPLDTLRREFAILPQDRPVTEIMDSLSATVLRIILSDARIEFDPDQTLAGYAAAMAADAGIDTAPPDQDVIRIVSLADRRLFKRLDESHIDALEAALGARVEFEHVCLPPAPVLLSDLIFADYFLPRIEDRAPYASVWTQLKKLRDASLILMDDAAELHFSLMQTYPVLSHRLERAPEADLLAFRWQAYVYGHDKLPFAPVAGIDLDLADRDISIDYLSRYLGVPVFRIATVESLSRYTESWDYKAIQSLSGGPGLRPLAIPAFLEALQSWIAARPEPLTPRSAAGTTRLRLDDLPHFCSWAISKASVDQVIDAFDRFCLAGGSYSIPYIAKEIAARGKSMSKVTTPSAAALAQVSDFDCLVICGPTVKPETDLPIASVMGGVTGARMVNTEDPRLRGLSFRGKLESCHPDEWYHVSTVSGQSSDIEPIKRDNIAAAAKRDARKSARESGAAEPAGIAGPREPPRSSTQSNAQGETVMVDKASETEEQRKARVKQERIAERQEARRAERQAERAAGAAKAASAEKG